MLQCSRSLISIFLKEHCQVSFKLPNIIYRICVSGRKIYNIYIKKKLKMQFPQPSPKYLEFV